MNDRQIAEHRKRKEAMLAAADAFVLMVELHRENPEQEAILAEASAAGVGILVKKGLASGALSPEQAIPWLLEHAEVSSIVIGGSSLGNVQQNVAIARASS